MVDGPTEATDRVLTEANRTLVRTFVEEVLIARRLDRLDAFLSASEFRQHNPNSEDGSDIVRADLERSVEGEHAVVYTRLHRVLAEGNFVLAVIEGSSGGVHTAFYNLFRVDEGKLVEQWDTIEAVAPNSEWKHDNGKF